MAEAKQYSYSYKELAELLVKKQGIHEGLWGVYVKFGLQAANMGPTEDQQMPAAIIPIVEIGLQKFDKESNLTVDAALVNPATRMVAPERI